MKIEISQVITQIISFLIMLWVLKRYAWRPLLKVMDDRQHKIQADFSTIEEQKKENERLMSEYQEKLKAIDVESSVLLKGAYEKGNRLFKEIEDEARAEAKMILTKAQEELQNEIFKAKIQLKDELVKMTLMATQKIIQTSLDTEKSKKLIGEFIEQARIN